MGIKEIRSNNKKYRNTEKGKTRQQNNKKCKFKGKDFSYKIQSFPKSSNLSQIFLNKIDQCSFAYIYNEIFKLFKEIYSIKIIFYNQV